MASSDTITLAAALGAQKWINEVINNHKEYPEFAWIEPETPEYYVWAYVKMEANVGYLVVHDKLDKLILDLCGVAMLTYEVVGLAAKVKTLPVGRTVVIEDATLKTVAEAEELFAELTANGVKFTREATQWICRTPSGNITWLEIGNDSAGLQHIIMLRHSTEFSSWGLSSQEAVLTLIENAVKNGTPSLWRVWRNNRQCSNEASESKRLESGWNSRK